MPNADLIALIDSFERSAPRSPNRLPTFMEIAGYPQYENVCSNVLQFFLDPIEAHGLGTLFLDVLCRAGELELDPGDLGGVVTVEREVITENSKRIDLLIESDGALILIENKLFAALDNPFGEYRDYLALRAAKTKPSKKPLKLLLSLKRSTEAEALEFRNLTYRRFIDGIRASLDSYVARANSGYVTFLLDFLRTLDNLQGSVAMDNAFIEFVADRKEAVEDFIGEIVKLRAELRRKVKEVRQHVDLTASKGVIQFMWRDPNPQFLEDNLVHEIKRSDTFTIAIDAAVTPACWKIEIFCRPSDDQPALDRANRVNLEDLLAEAKLKVIENTNRDRFELPDNLPYLTPPGKIAERVIDVVDKLATK